MAEGELVQGDLVKLSDVGKRLLTMAGSTSPKESLIEDLKQASTLLGRLKQSLSQPDVHSAVKPSMDALIEPSLLKHEDEDVQLLVAKCVSDIMRIAAPDAPFSDETLKEIFELIVSSFKGLNDRSSPYFDIRVNILEMVATTRSCVVMLDLQCDDLILEMFKTFFETVSEEPNNVLVATRAIMCLVLDDSEEIPTQLLEVLLQNVLNAKKGAIKSCSILAGAVLGRCAEKVGPAVQDFLAGILDEEASPKNKWRESYNDLIFAIYKRAPTLLFEIYTCAPNLLVPVIPMLIDELLIDQLDVRLRAVRAVGWLFSLRNGPLPDGFNRLHEEYMKRFQDDDVAIRLAVVEGAKKCLIADPFDEAIEFLRELGKRVDDKDTRVRLSTIDAICECANSNPELISIEEGKASLTAMGAVCIDVLKKVAECLQDTEISIRRQTLEKLSSLYKASCLKEVSGSTLAREFLNWIPVKLFGCQQEFRTQDIDLLLSEQLFPAGFPVNERVKCWISFFCVSRKEDIFSLKCILRQKQRLQKEINSYLLIQDKQKLKDEENEENKRELRAFSKILGRAFSEPANAESEITEFFLQQRDTESLKEFAKLLDPSTTFSESESLLEGLTSQLGVGHIIRVLAIKCSYLLFGKEHLQALLQEIDEFRKIGNEKMLEASMGLLVLFVRYFPSILGGLEGRLMEVLKDNKQYFKESTLEILVKVRDYLTGEHMSLDFLGDLCSDGSCKQAKYAIQVLADILGPKAFFSLFMKLLDHLETDGNLPTDAFSASNTQEEGVMNLIVTNFLRKESGSASAEETNNDSVTKMTRLKIFGLKALVRVFCSVPDIESFKKLSEVLSKFLNNREPSNDKESSLIDNDHLQLAAANAVLHLSKSYEADISPQLFTSTVLCARHSSVYVRDQFFMKLHKLSEQGVVSHMYGCAFVFGIGGDQNEFPEVMRHLSDLMERSRHQAWLLKAHNSENSKAPSVTYSPEYLLFYLVHTIAQENEGGPSVESVQCAFKKLSLFISALLNQYDQSEREKKEKTGLILDIFRKMKNAEDVVDNSKTENTYILCDIGIAIMKEVSEMVVSPVEDLHNIPLPSLIYRALEPTEGDVKMDGSHLPPHLLSVLPLKINKASTAKKEKRKPDVGIFKKVPQSKRSKLSGSSPMDKEQIDNIPSKVHHSSEKGSDYKKVNSNSHTLPTPPIENGKKAVDSQLAMAIPTKRKRSQLHKENGEGSALDAKQVNADESLTQSEHKHKKMKVEDAEGGSMSDTDHLATTEVDSRIETPEADVSDRNPMQVLIQASKPLEGHEKEPSAEDDQTITKVKRGKQVTSVLKDGKVVESLLNPRGTPKQSTKKAMPSESEATDDSKGIKVAETLSSPRITPKQSTKKIMPSESASPSVKVDKKAEASPRGLVGCRVKVWWPMDKAFYQGVIASYHAPTKKHKIIYDDGDQENLKLDSERWELVENADEGLSSTPASLEHDSRSKKKDAKSQPTKNLSKETDHRMSQKQSKHSRAKDLDESEHTSDVNDEAPVHEKRNPGDGDERKLTTVSKARSLGKKVVTSSAKALQSLEGGISPTISKESSEDVPLNAWKGARRKARS